MDLHEYLNHITSSTNMTCLTPSEDNSVRFELHDHAASSLVVNFVLHCV